MSLDPTPESISSYKFIFSGNPPSRYLLNEDERTPITYDKKNMLKKLKTEEVYERDLNYNLIPDVLLYHQDGLVHHRGLRIPKISNHQLHVLSTTVVKSCIALDIGNDSMNQRILQQLSDKKKIKLDEFSHLVNNAKEFVQFYKDQSKVIELLISKNTGNKSILDRLKTIIDNGYFSNNGETRYYQFCTLEFEKEKIFDSGHVPLGWLPSDIEPLFPLVEELQKSKKKQGTLNQVMAFGLLANFVGDMQWRNN